jgi:phosphoribosylglycinamide formyltransferase-1
VHYVTETVDGGSLILQRIIGIQNATTAEDIAKRVMAEEKGALIDAIRMIAREESET